MNKKEYIKRSEAITEKMLALENEFSSLISEYYKAAKNEKGNIGTDFYKEMSGVLDTCERSVFSLRDKLLDPDSIQGYDTK